MTAKEFISSLFDQWQSGESAAFFDALADDVQWTVRGETPISGTWAGKAAYLDNVYRPLLSIFTGPTQCRVHNIIADGNLVVVEWHGETPTVSGTLYSQDYCWVLHVEGHTIREVVGYFDTALVTHLLTATK
ncbi:MAG: snoaL-like protein [Planctomycetaceae bacterium]|jgi:uncharacterized protein|nr:snoaL-like protein [Planctomycetaceae bacterium]